MLQVGIIHKTSENTATVEIKRSTACGENCASCGLCSNRTASVEAINDIGAKSGDFVIISTPDKKVLGAAFLVYIVPIIALILGYALGGVIFRKELVSILCGFVFMAICFVAIVLFDKKRKKDYTPHIVNFARDITSL